MTASKAVKTPATKTTKTPAVKAPAAKKPPAPKVKAPAKKAAKGTPLPELDAALGIGLPPFAHPVPAKKAELAEQLAGNPVAQGNVESWNAGKTNPAIVAAEAASVPLTDAPAGFGDTVTTSTAPVAEQAAAVAAKVEAAKAAAPAKKAAKAKADKPAKLAVRDLKPVEAWGARGVLALVCSIGGVTTPEVKLAFGKTQQQAFAVLNGLAAAGAIKAGGTAGRRVWEPVGTFEEAATKLGAAKAPRAAKAQNSTKAARVGAPAVEEVTPPNATPAPVKLTPGAIPAAIAKHEAKKAAIVIAVGDSVKVSSLFAPEYVDLIGTRLTGYVVVELQKKFAVVTPAKGGERARINVAHLVKE